MSAVPAPGLTLCHGIFRSKAATSICFDGFAALFEAGDDVKDRVVEMTSPKFASGHGFWTRAFADCGKQLNVQIVS